MKKKTEAEFAYKFGRMIKGQSSLMLSDDQLSDTLNLTPGYGWKQRKGMTALTASAVATGLRFKSAIQFRTLDGSTDCLLAHTYDSTNGERIMKGSALPPNSITWSEMYDLTAGCEIAQWANVANAIVVATGEDFIIWLGEEHKPTGIFYFDETVGNYINYYDEVTDGDTATSMPLNSFDAGNDFWYAISEMPVTDVMATVGNTNSNNAVLVGYFWNGSGWSQIMAANGCGAMTDGTEDSQLREEFEGTVIDTSKWTESDASGKLSQDNDLVFVPDTDSTSAQIYSQGKVDLVGDFDIVCHVTVGTDTPNTPSGYNDFRFYVKGMVVSNNDGYVGRQWTTSTRRHYSDIRIGGVRQDEGWTEIAQSNGELTWYYRFTRISNSLVAYEGEPGDWTEIARDDTWTTENVQVVCYFNCQKEASWDGNAHVHWIREGTSLNTAGKNTISWETAPSTELPTSLEGIPGYVYKFGYTNDLDASVDIQEVGLYSPWNPVGNLWDGSKTFVTGCYVYDGTKYKDYTAYVNNDVEAQGAVLNGATTSYRLFVGSPYRLSGIEFYPASDEQNTQNAQVDAVYYHNAGAAETAVSSFEDGTLAGTAGFGQKGTITWLDPGKENEKPVTVGGDTSPMYWYIFEWDATLSDPTTLYRIRGIPIGEAILPSKGVLAFKRRVWQIAPSGEENAVRFSAANLPTVWNGLDSGYIYFGERPLVAAVSLYNEAMVFADTEIWMIKGSTRSHFERLRLSGTIGCSAVNSIVTVESGILVDEKIKNVVTWFFADGIWVFDNSRIWKISAPDIDSFFDPLHEDYINPAYLDQTYGTYDHESQTAQWIVYSGASATTPTKVIVMHFPSMWYGIYEYGTEISCILPVINDRYYTVGGAFDTGKFFRLYDGITDLDDSGNTVAVDAYAVTRDMFISVSDGMRQRLLSVWAESAAAGGMIELDEYPDGSVTPQNIGKRSMTWLGKLFGVFQRNLKVFSGQKTTKFRVRNRSKNARMVLIGHSTTADRGRAEE